MEGYRRGASGKRLFTAEFKRAQVGRVVRGEVTIAELSRELEVSPSLVRRWKHLSETGGGRCGICQRSGGAGLQVEGSGAAD